MFVERMKGGTEEEPSASLVHPSTQNIPGKLCAVALAERSDHRQHCVAPWEWPSAGLLGSTEKWGAC